MLGGGYVGVVRPWADDGGKFEAAWKTHMSAYQKTREKKARKR